MRNERGTKLSAKRRAACEERPTPLQQHTLPAVVLHRALNIMTDSLTLPAWLMQFSGLSDVGQVGGILKMLGAYAPHVKMANLASPHVIAINLSEQDRGHATHRLDVTGGMLYCAIALIYNSAQDLETGASHPELDAPPLALSLQPHGLPPPYTRHGVQAG